MQENAIIVEDVHKSFRDVRALDGLSLIARQSKVFSLLGPNGAGKTTLIRILTTLLKPDQGLVNVAGIDVLKEPGRLREIIGVAGQYTTVDDNLTGHENLELVGRLYHMSRSDARNRATELLELLALKDAKNRIVKTYSGGMRRRLDLGASIVARPQILFLDEPTTGLDPRGRLELWNIIRELVKEGTTVLLTTQYLDEADALADYIAVIDKGKVIVEGTSDQLKSQLGQDIVEFQLASFDDLQLASGAVESIAVEPPLIDHETGKISLFVEKGSKDLISVVHLLNQANLAVIDIELRRPSLDEVFLTVTEDVGSKGR